MKELFGSYFKSLNGGMYNVRCSSSWWKTV